MRIRKYDFDYSRRQFAEKVALGLGAGILAPTWQTIAATGEVAKAYPDELTSIELQTKGKIKPGDLIDAKNVEHAKHLMDPIMYKQVSEMGRRLRVRAPNKDITQFFPHAYLEATLKNNGKASFDETGNVVETATKGPWIGGNPFPDIKTGQEGIANLTLSWGRHDMSQYAVRSYSLNPDGSPAYTYDLYWTELNTTARTEGDPVFQGKKDMLRYQSVFFTAPQEQAGASFLVPWYYDQRKFPDIYGYLPQFRRVRQFPANQRFEPIVPGLSFFLSDAWGAGDPMLTWGNTKIVGRGPLLVAGAGNFKGKSNANWENHSWHGGPKGKTFMEYTVELAPECVAIESEPTGYPRAPVGKKKVWVDARNGMLVAYITFDRRGQLWKQVDAAFGPQIEGDFINKDRHGKPHWSWTNVHFHDIQSGRMDLFNHCKQIAGGYASQYEAPNGDEKAIVDKFCTQAAIARLGAV
ncbi:uncharacterized protein DUF1329 [Panacagrimonas perspica]|uniref:Uncharacterized protein DUF1329 n=2 Tax=Gammaproteobacteria TaxID=1236 RepID=A0A4V3F4Y1_9GAMM|nr:DUF1329 domain-containing protein [Panacagrimonas perspica]TDU26846.1 uncharacterized protein DUF1329 [Panacagrimonas perspica]THD03620.1 hypothetical protein B1810_08710 [Panacagrimonas perspica]